MKVGRPCPGTRARQDAAARDALMSASPVVRPEPIGLGRLCRKRTRQRSGPRRDEFNDAARIARDAGVSHGIPLRGTPVLPTVVPVHRGERLGRGSQSEHGAGSVFEPVGIQYWMPTDRSSGLRGVGGVSVAGVDIAAVDERDSSWEDHRPLFRVYLFQGGDRPGSSWATGTYDVSGADALEVIDWARGEAGDGLFAVALVRDGLGRTGEIRRGLVWLVGHDANDRPASETEQHLADRMHARRTNSR
jgi:hypothetical protein